MTEEKPLTFSSEDVQALFEALYKKYHKPLYLRTDPLILLYDYPDPYDREIVGLLVSSLAYGRAEQILRSCRRILELLGSSPRKTLLKYPPTRIETQLKNFKHRFTGGEEIAFLMRSIRRVLLQYGSLGELFASNYRPWHDTVLEAACSFVKTLTNGKRSTVLPNPRRGSACKRLFMYLRWQVRCDEIDPGGWDGVPPKALIVPLDTHMFRLCRLLGITARKRADLKAALEITRFFKSLSPEDPVRYDFSLTRPGIHEGLTAKSIKKALNLFSEKGTFL